MKAALDPYLDEPINTADHEYAVRIYDECRNRGVEAGTVDILIGALAVRRGWESPLWRWRPESLPYRRKEVSRKAKEDCGDGRGQITSHFRKS